MRIKKDDVIAGQPVLTIKKLLKHREGTITTIAEALNVDQKEATQIFRTLHSEGYIEQLDGCNDSSRENLSWENTMKGNALVSASTRKPITRQTAERLLKEFLQRVETMNASNDYAYHVKQVILFGSYLSDNSTLGDIDLSLVLEFRDDDLEKRHKHLEERRKLAQKQGRQLNSVMERAVWPYEEVRQFLKNRSPSLSLHNEEVEQVLTKISPSKIIFDISETKI